MNHSFRRLGATTFALMILGGCSSTVDPSTVDLTGEWRATVGSLGLQFITLDLTEADRQLTGTAVFTGAAAPGASGTMTANGLHFGLDVQLNMTFQTTTGDLHLSATGQVVDDHHFYLVFPTDAAPLKVTFVR